MTVERGPATGAAGPDLAPERRRRRPVLWTAVAVGVAVLGLVSVLATRPSASTRAVHSPLLGKPAPEVTAQTVAGARFSLADVRGRWVVVNFFATWCVPCRQEHDDLLRFQARHATLGDAQVVGVVYDDSAKAVEEFLREEGGTWPMLADPGGRIALEFGVAAVPESFLLTPDGVVAAKIVGGLRWEALEALLGQAQAEARAPSGQVTGPRR